MLDASWRFELVIHSRAIPVADKVTGIAVCYPRKCTCLGQGAERVVRTSERANQYG